MMVSTMNDITNRVNELAEENWDWILKAIDQKLLENEAGEYESYAESAEVDGDDDDDGKRKQQSPLHKIYGQMQMYMYAYACISAESLKFLDMSQFWLLGRLMPAF
ncbi:hypothetical protein ACF0H5_004548 [Mactra antiquata]